MAVPLMRMAMAPRSISGWRPAWTAMRALQAGARSQGDDDHSRQRHCGTKQVPINQRQPLNQREAAQRHRDVDHAAGRVGAPGG